LSPYAPQKKSKVGKLVSLQRIVQEVSSAPDLPAASRIVVKRVRETMHTDVCSIYLTERSTGTLVLSATEGLNPAAIGKVRLDSEQGLVGLAATSSEPINVRDAARHPRFKLIPLCEEAPYHGFLGVPVIHRGETLGVIVVQQAQERRYRDTDVAFLVTLAAQLAGVITLARANGAVELVASGHRRNDTYVDAIAGAPGVALGVGAVAYSAAELESVPDRVPQDPHAEEAAFHTAVSQVVNELRRLQTDFGNTLLPEDLALFEALAMIASSDMLVEATVERIHAGNWAPGALRDTIDQYADQFMAIDDAYLRERARDIRDLGRRILAHLLQSGDAQRDYPARTILVGEDLGPIDLGKVPVDRLAGLISGHGSSLSHLAILARAMGIPAVVGTSGLVPLSQLEAAALIIDGYRGRLYVNPADAVRQEFSRLEREEQALSRELGHLRDLPAETPDGFRVALYANAGILADLTQSLSVGAEGIGLYRTELPFMLREQFPGEEEQRLLYRQVLEAFAPNPVTLRTLDVGGDKPLPYFPVNEANPALGWRGIRFALDNPVILITQLRAMLRASVGLENLRILIPMVGSVDEAEEAVHLLQRSWQELTDEGVEVVLPPCGLMVEVPSAVYQAAELARCVDFLSIGTNDLTQYLLAMDRGNERVAARFDSLHPAVIRALQQVMEAGEQQHKPVSVCGQAAGDPAMVILLLGMGIRSLSLSAGDLPRIKSVIRTFSRAQAQSLLNEVLQMEKAAEIRKLLSAALVQAGLGGLVRAGK
jgi:phosphotransferase system enzyme I (PtsP)